MQIVVVKHGGLGSVADLFIQHIALPFNAQDYCCLGGELIAGKEENLWSAASNISPVLKKLWSKAFLPIYATSDADFEFC